MKKLKLDLDTLDVKSFEAGTPALPMEGTVQGHVTIVIATAPYVGATIASYFVCE